MKPRRHPNQIPAMDLSHLSEAECEVIFSVLQKDFEIRALEKARLRRIYKSVKDEDYAAEILTQNNHEFEERHCVRCFGNFIFLFNPAVYCFTCRLKVCRRCTSFVRDFNSLVCSTCLRDRDYITASCQWYYEEIRRRFRQPSGSAKVARSLSLSGGKLKNSIPRSKRSIMDPTAFQSNASSSESDGRSLSSVEIQKKSNKVRNSCKDKELNGAAGDEEIKLFKNLQGQQVARFHENVDNALKNLHEDLRSGKIASVTLKELPMPGNDLKYDLLIKEYRDRIAQLVANFAQLLYVAFENANVNLCQSTDDLHEQVQDLIQAEVERLLGYNIDNIIQEEIAEEEESSVGLAGGKIENRLSCAIVNKALEEHSIWLQKENNVAWAGQNTGHAQRVPGLTGEWLFGEVDPDLLSLSGSRMDMDDEIEMYRKSSSHQSFADSWSAAALFERSGGAAEVAKALYNLAAKKSLPKSEDDNSDGLSDLDCTCLPDEENVDLLVDAANSQKNFSKTEHKISASDSADADDFEDIYRQNLTNGESGKCENKLQKTSVSDSQNKVKEFLGVLNGNVQLKSQLKGDAFWYRMDADGMVALDEKQHEGKYMTESGFHNDVHVLKIKHLAASDEGEYLCIVVNGEDCDKTSETFRVTLLDLPSSASSSKNAQLETLNLSKRIAGTRQATSALAESTKTSALKMANLQVELQNVEDRLDNVANDVSQSTYGLRSVTNQLAAELVRAELKMDSNQSLKTKNQDLSSKGNKARMVRNLHQKQVNKEHLEESVYASAGNVFSLKERLSELENSLSAGKVNHSHSAEWDRLQAEVERSVQLCEESQHRVERLESAAEELNNRQHNFEELKGRFSRETEGLKRISSITMRTLPREVAQRVDLRRSIIRTDNPSEISSSLLNNTTFKQKEMSPAMNSLEKVIEIAVPTQLSSNLLTNSPTCSRASSGSISKSPNEKFTSRSPEFASVSLRKTGRDLRGVSNTGVSDHIASDEK